MIEKLYEGNDCEYSLRNPLHSPLGRLEEYLQPYSTGDIVYEAVVSGQLVTSWLIGLKCHWKILPSTHSFANLNSKRRSVIRLKSFLQPYLYVNKPLCSLLDAHQWHHSYFHWFFDALPKVLACLDYQQKAAEEVNLLVPHDIKHWQKDSIELLGYGSKNQILIDQSAVKSHIFCRVLVAASSSRAHGLKGAPYDCMSPNIIRQLSYMITKNLPSIHLSGSPRRIYISRNDAATRRIVNELEFTNILSSYGFVSVYLAGMTLLNQINLFREATHIIGVHGGGLTNLLFSSNANVIELFSDGHGIRPDYFQLAMIKSLEYRFHVFPSVNNLNDIYVDPAIVVQLLDSFD